MSSRSRKFSTSSQRARPRRRLSQGLSRDVPLVRDSRASPPRRRGNEMEKKDLLSQSKSRSRLPQRCGKKPCLRQWERKARAREGSPRPSEKPRKRAASPSSNNDGQRPEKRRKSCGAPSPKSERPGYSKRHWDDTDVYKEMEGNRDVRRFLSSPQFRKATLKPEEFDRFLCSVTEITKESPDIRHQFLIRLMQSPFLEGQGPIFGTIQTLMNPQNWDESYKSGVILLVGLLEEFSFRIPHVRNTRVYLTTVTELLKMTSIIPTLGDDVCQKVKRIEENLVDPCLLLDSIESSMRNWSPDVSFIKESIIPEDMEQLLCGKLAKCFYNPVKGGHHSPAHYLETWYRIMREDFIGPLRDAVKDFKTTFKPSDRLQNRRVRLDGGYHYFIEKILDREEVDGEYLCLVEYSLKHLKHINWSHTDRLRSDSMLVLSDDHFKTARYAMITRNWSKPAEAGRVWLKMIGEPLKFSESYHAIEPMALYEPYRCVLQRLKVQAAIVDKGGQLPMGRYFVHCMSEVQRPSYIPQNASLKLPDGTDTDAWYPSIDLALDESQQEALKLALTHELALIQGPPGTGKSHVGAIFVQTMMLNKNLWQTHGRGCVLLLAYKNHAIDQFIGECEKMGMDMSATIRIGSRCDSGTKTYRLKEKTAALRDYKEFFYLTRNLSTLRKQLKELEENIKICERGLRADRKDIGFRFYVVYIPVQFMDGFRCSSPCHDDNEAEKQFSEAVKKWIAGDSGFAELHYELDRVRLIDFQTAENIYRRSGGNLHKVGLRNRRELFLFWCNSAVMDVNRHLHAFRLWKRSLLKEIESHQRALDIATVRRADIIAMTTTGASKYGYLLDAVKPSIVLVEEAAEVMESHIVAPLTIGCKHVVLIGDHQQLRPQVCNFEMEKRNLSVSLFERLVTNGLPCRRLQKQHRMHPIIASILVPHIYSSLDHHPAVETYPDVTGLQKRMHFFHHEHREERVGEKSSCQNVFEADYVVGLSHYLLGQNYQPADITILTTYMGQMRLIKEKIKDFCNKHPHPTYTHREKAVLLENKFSEYLNKSNNVLAKWEFVDRKTAEWRDRQRDEYNSYERNLGSKLKDVRVTTVDNYQGEENKIVLLSFVRSNPECAIGFLKWPNRICVALSRAKHGFYAIGDFKLFAKSTKSDLWKKLCAQLLSAPDPCLSSKLPLSCKMHGLILELNDPKSFEMLAVDGGCQKPCEFRLQCGHVCSRKCHVDDEAHENFICRKRCSGTLCCSHTCGYPCHERQCEGHSATTLRQCNNCSKMIECQATVEIVPEKCGHKNTTQCSKINSYVCKELVLETLSCGHEMSHICRDRSRLCSVIVVRKLKCDHEKAMKCYQNSEQVKCQTEVVKHLTCNHSKAMLCHQDESQAYCDEPVEIVLPCNHTETVPCSEKSRPHSCDQRVEVPLACGHTKQMLCSEKNLAVSVLCDARIIISHPCMHVHEISCHEATSSRPCDVSVILKLPCGHSIPGKCFKMQSSMEQLCPFMVPFKRPCGHTLPIPCHRFETLRRNGGLEQTLCLLEGEPLCHENVKEILPCGHAMTGPCWNFDRLKQNGCGRTVNFTRPCGHDLRIPCFEKSTFVPASPCEERCISVCPHQVECKGLCGEICPRCTKPCLNRCAHYQCSRLCFEDCDRPPCNHRCRLRLICGHFCSGFCGEPCPITCVVCWRLEDRQSRICLYPCKHDFTVTQMDEYMRTRENDVLTEVRPKFCPLCQRIITYCPRYMNQIRVYIRLRKFEFYSPENDWWFCKRGNHLLGTPKDAHLDIISNHVCEDYMQMAPSRNEPRISHQDYTTGMPELDGDDEMDQTEETLPGRNVATRMPSSLRSDLFFRQFNDPESPLKLPYTFSEYNQPAKVGRRQDRISDRNATSRFENSGGSSRFSCPNYQRDSVSIIDSREGFVPTPDNIISENSGRRDLDYGQFVHSAGDAGEVVRDGRGGEINRGGRGGEINRGGRGGEINRGGRGGKTGTSLTEPSRSHLGEDAGGRNSNDDDTFDSGPEEGEIVSDSDTETGV